ncbi:MAG: IS3 family transposase [Bdellovibrionales bacterium]|nr:IS3 family transposase [Bdellovibrionales bacterium]
MAYRKNFKTREEANQSIFEWIEVWCNRYRRQSGLEYMSLEEYEI